MIGTIVNTCTIIVGSLIGAMLKKGIKPQYQTALFNAMGVVSLAIGLRAFITYMPQSQYPVLFIVSLSVGSLVGYMLDIDGRFNRLVTKHSKGNLGEGLSIGILLYCIGALSMLGPVISALQGDNTFLFTNATLDLVTSAVLATTYGIGMIWAAPVLFCWQGMFYLIARISATAISNDLIAELSVVGGLLILAAGLNLLKIKDCQTLNMLPSLIVPVIFFLIKSLF